MMSGLDVLAVFEVDQSPVLRIAPEDDVASTASVASVGSALGNVLLAPQMRGSVSSVPRSAEYLHVVYEIAVWHNYELLHLCKDMHSFDVTTTFMPNLKKE